MLKRKRKKYFLEQGIIRPDELNLWEVVVFSKEKVILLPTINSLLEGNLEDSIMASVVEINGEKNPISSQDNLGALIVLFL